MLQKYQLKYLSLVLSLTDSHHELREQMNLNLKTIPFLKNDSLKILFKTLLARMLISEYGKIFFIIIKFIKKSRKIEKLHSNVY